MGPAAAVHMDPYRGPTRVRWRSLGDPERGGRVGTVGEGGFGTVILDALVEKQLQGSITRDWRADSVTIALEIVTR